MNWNKVKEKLPKTYNELLSFHKETGFDGDRLMDEFLKSKGYKVGHTWINQIKEYESSLPDESANEQLTIFDCGT